MHIHMLYIAYCCILLNQLPSFYFIQDLKFDLIEIPVFIFMAVIGKILLSHILFNKSRSDAYSALNPVAFNLYDLTELLS